MLALDKLSAGYGGFRALFDVSLEVKAGETVAVIGPNGAGKTTLLRAVSRLIDPSAGTLSLEGQSLNRVPPHELVARGIAHVPENRRLFPRLTVEENLRMGAFLPAARAKFAQRLEQVYQLFPRMQERRRQPAGTLSGGEQQMCAMGRALMARPKLLMLDEPSLGLSPILVETIFSIIREINSTGTPVLLVEQNAHKALEVANRGYVIETGVIVQTGTGKELLESEDVQRAYLGM
jgi:branched-chain amino acid transport system ATP-binding protein